MEIESIKITQNILNINVRESHQESENNKLSVKIGKTTFIAERYSFDPQVFKCNIFGLEAGIHQTLTILGQDITYSLVEEKEIFVELSNIFVIEKVLSQFFISKFPRPYLLNTENRTNFNGMLKLPVINVNSSFLFLKNEQELEKYNSIKDLNSGFLHVNPFSSKFECIDNNTVSDRPVYDKTIFLSNINYIEEYNLSLKLLNYPNEIIEHCYLIAGNNILLGSVLGNNIIFNFTEIDIFSIKEKVEWSVKVITKNAVFNGNLKLSNQTPMLIGSNTTVFDEKLYLMSNLLNQKISKQSFSVKEFCSVSVISDENGSLVLEMSNLSPQVVLVLKKRSTSDIQRIFGNVLRKKNDSQEVLFDLRSFMFEESRNLKSSRWDAYLQIYDGINSKVVRAKNINIYNTVKHEKYGTVFEPNVNYYSTYNQNFEFYYTVNSNLALVKNKKSKLLAERFEIKARMEWLKFNSKKQYAMQILVEGEDMDRLKFKNVILVNRNKLNYNAVSLNTTIVFKKNKRIRVRSLLNPEKISLIPFYWDIYFEVEDEFGNDSLIQIDSSNRSVQQYIRSKALDIQAHVEGDLLAPYVTVDNSVSFVFHPIQDFETKQNYMREKIAYVVAKILSPILKKQHIWISYEKNAMGAHDNGFHFFKYMYENSKHNHFYYVIREDSPEYGNLSHMSNRVLKYMSFKYFVYMFSAELFISSDTKYHGYNLHQRDSRLGQSMSKVKEVYLQHGVNGLKQVPAFHKKRGLLDFIIVPDEYEKKMVTQQWGYDENHVAVTGLARWDSYSDLADTVSFNQIFVMPTWRKWMDGMSHEKFVETPFYHQYQSFLSSPRLKKLLVESNSRIAFFLHPYFKNYVELFKVDNTIIDQYGYLDVDMGTEIQKSVMMISDYSSVLWDMYYLKKPVIFYQFDREAYLETEKSYMNYETELFGDETFSPETTIDAIEEYIKNGFKEKEKFEYMRNNFFTYMDHNNSKRIYEAIQSSKKYLGINM